MREWSFLTAMKQRIVRKSGKVFQSPILLVDELTHAQRRHSSTKRQERAHTTTHTHMHTLLLVHLFAYECSSILRLSPRQSSCLLVLFCSFSLSPILPVSVHSSSIFSSICLLCVRMIISPITLLSLCLSLSLHCLPLLVRIPDMYVVSVIILC